MNDHPFGRTGLTVSAIGFGGAPAGLRNYLGQWEPEDPTSEDRIVAAITQAFSLGINYYDTAPGYGDGASERMFGRAVRPFRDQVILATKAGCTTRDDLLRSAEASLTRLGVDYLDVLQIHGGWYTDADVDTILAPGGALEGLQQLKSQGLVRHIGFTTEGANGPASRLVASAAFDVMQCCYNLIYQHPYDPSRRAGLLYEAEAQGMGILTMRPLTSGIFQKWLAHVFPEDLQSPERQERLNQSLLAFVLSNPLVDCALVGMRDPAEARRNAAIAADPSLRLDLDWLHERYV